MRQHMTVDSFLTPIIFRTSHPTSPVEPQKTRRHVFSIRALAWDPFFSLCGRSEAPKEKIRLIPTERIRPPLCRRGTGEKSVPRRTTSFPLLCTVLWTLNSDL
ncbi:hypothetical protein CEXT_76571 [Caerostris extrusa]|uniref:Uncharacterized protein n=1 Tax=Caerostris extrusa TaxID=172846 RepID=A0AAV4WJ76_CAEEX|nr:hypothetical protein CEXT_76571 [Caerostris extrusa]